MFRVRVYKIVWNKQQKEVNDILLDQSARNSELNTSTYFYDITLEFPPFLGLELSSQNWASGKIIRVSWDVDKKSFYCYTDDEFPYETDAYDYDEDYLNGECIRHGWKQLTLNEAK